MQALHYSQLNRNFTRFAREGTPSR
jgi:hypothetical protein